VFLNAFKTNIDSIQVKMIDFSNVALLQVGSYLINGKIESKKIAVIDVPVGNYDYFPLTLH